ncbi:Detected protein of confused Function [Hibiscus syriacus]|uniref:Detected protein of confused Function n=1 Tax=Hibiscus syriacus TaxID=106335 RepID=A0A6A3AKP7_HIBSY|nr:Detected protein of confused Function [Hibiscus syriacus]
MRKRDLAILMLSAFAIFFFLQHEGDLSFREAWYHLSDEYPIKYEAERLPPPLVVDLNGDGKKEILVATHDAKMQVLEPHARRVDEGFSEARVLTEVSLLPDKIRVASGRRPVAMATGFVFDLSVTWYQVVLFLIVLGLCGVGQEDFPHNAHHREIAISISNYTLKHGDSGLVIVGGRMEMQPHLYLDPFEEIGMAERSAEQHRRSANEKEASENSGTVNLHHFAFYAFDGRKGGLRWSRKNENIEEHSSDSSQLIPQHNYKLDVHALNTRHPGEFECREFRESILGVMPHHWDRREDTSLELSHFKRHKRKTLKKIAGSAKSKKPMAYIPTITNYTQLWWVPNVVVAHQKEGIEAVHLASGRTVCKLHLQEGGLHADINGDGVLDHVQAVGGNGAEQTVVSGSMEVLRPCWAVATSGVPVREQLFNASICHHSYFHLFQHGEFYRGYGRTANVASLEAATPILIPKSDGHRHRKGSHGDVIFLTNRGEVTAYSPGLHGHGAEWQWQLLTDATCSLTSIDLPAPPTHALITEDFSNDGLTHIILVTSSGVYGFVQARQPGALFFSTLVGYLLLVMGVIFVTQHLNSMKGKPRASPGPR